MKLFKQTAVIIALILTILLMASCEEKSDGRYEPDADLQIQNFSRNPIAVIEMEGGGKMAFELYPDKAPSAVSNFVDLADNGFYDGLTFHRIMEDFAIMGGDPLGNGTGKTARAIEGEFESNGFSGNDISHERGAISMARLNSDYNSASCQFFIITSDAPALNGSYAAFGMLVDGFGELDRLSELPTRSDIPVDAPVIKSITIE